MLLFIILLLITVRLYYVYSRQIPSIAINNVHKIGKTGDLIMFSAHYPYDKKLTMIGKTVLTLKHFIYNTIFTHVGILVKKDNQLYVVDIEREPGVPNMVKLEDKVKKYYGSVFYKPLNKKLKYSYEYKIKQFVKNMSDKYVFPQNIVKKCVLCDLLGIFCKTKKEEMLCTDLIMKIFIYSNLVYHSNLKCTTPHYFNIQHFTMKNGYRYLDSYLIN